MEYVKLYFIIKGNREMKKYIKYAFSRTLPVLFGYIFLGIAFGIVLQQAGFNFIWAFCISLFLYAGSMQFVLVPLRPRPSPSRHFSSTAAIFFTVCRLLNPSKKWRRSSTWFFLCRMKPIPSSAAAKTKIRRKRTDQPGFSSTCLTKATGSSVLSSALCLVRYCHLTLPVLIKAADAGFP